ncbi:cytochrome C oxidase subunit IV family protein [Nocardia sp. NPDC052112]|uniref:cytochrome C oxidase subunit IV family protein n=1 Tax=Nocardia sp. NPDC052112 TaxID=3155646 RepID=UPI0034148656
MRTVFNNRLFAVWLLLSGLTLTYLVIAHSADNGGTITASRAATVAAIAIAIVKVRIIFREFMEVGHAPAILRRLTDLWIVIMSVSLLGTYLVGTWLVDT